MLPSRPVLFLLMAPGAMAHDGKLPLAPGVSHVDPWPTSSVTSCTDPAPPFILGPTCTIGFSGSYFLTANVALIRVESDNVRVDLNGYSVVGEGVRADGHENVLVRNGTVSGSISFVSPPGPGGGSAFFGVENVAVTRNPSHPLLGPIVSVTSGGRSIVVSIRRNTVDGGGISIQNARAGHVTDNIVSSSTDMFSSPLLEIGPGSEGLLVRGNSVVGGHVVMGGKHHLVIDNLLERGAYLVIGDGSSSSGVNRIARNTVANPVATGLVVRPHASRNQIVENSVLFGDQHGIDVQFQHNVLDWNVLTFNAGAGIYFTLGGNVFSFNRAAGNGSGPFAGAVTGNLDAGHNLP